MSSKFSYAAGADIRAMRQGFENSQANKSGMSSGVDKDVYCVCTHKF